MSPSASMSFDLTHLTPQQITSIQAIVASSTTQNNQPYPSSFQALQQNVPFATQQSPVSTQPFPNSPVSTQSSTLNVNSHIATIFCPQCTHTFTPEDGPPPRIANSSPVTPTTLIGSVIQEEFENRWYAIIRGHRVGWVKGDSCARLLVSGAPHNFHKGFSTENEVHLFYKQQRAIPGTVMVVGSTQAVADLTIPPGCRMLFP
ncbi:hypothetical protein E1B28_006807 [Marasmius oreades]|uniref:Uncharacterized protein n=1 Tax=Marasmius oreades TaxID=181124 RepID=A0A9P8AB78_9AGAR|nr:uncharacterized protein E1B28_006807 [Marasmius oreades]KAG7096133.1 hypothetical protein E1B28_006807 [Marasmius oreades]